MALILDFYISDALEFLKAFSLSERILSLPFKVQVKHIAALEKDGILAQDKNRCILYTTNCL